MTSKNTRHKKSRRAFPRDDPSKKEPGMGESSVTPQDVWRAERGE